MRGTVGSLLGFTLALSACAVHHATPYVPDTANAPLTSGAVEASSNCFEASTQAETAICAAPSLATPNRDMVEALQAGLRGTSIFGRDALLASQRVWLLALPGRCRLPNPHAVACLQRVLADRTATLRAWPAPVPVTGGAIAQYVSFRPSAGAAPQPDPAFCATFAQNANAALRTTGSLDPAAMGYAEVAGTHGPETAVPVAVDLYNANVFALFQRRARSVAVGAAAPVITPASLTELTYAQNVDNQGGRFSALASQTGDYASIDVFRERGRLLAVVADPWGFTTPASPGEAAHAGIWEISGAKPAPVCLYDTYTRPAEPGPFENLPNFTPWRDLLTQLRDSTDLPLGSATKREQGQLTADANFTLLFMPLLARQQAATASQTLWLRHRHDDVLDALFAWSTKSPANKPIFDQLFALLRPAAADLVRAYQTSEGLTAAEATQAGGIAIMELLYEATVNLEPGLGASPDLPAGTRPRYAILASPQ